MDVHSRRSKDLATLLAKIENKRQLGTNLADHFEAERFDFQPLRNIFAEMLQLATAVRADFLLW